MRLIIDSFLERLHLIPQNEPLVTLVRVAQENGEVRAWLSGLLALDDFNRKSAVQTLLANLRLQQAPGDFIEAVAALLDDGVARRAAELLGRAQNDI